MTPSIATIFPILITSYVAVAVGTRINFNPNDWILNLRGSVVPKQEKLSCEDVESINLNGTYLNIIPREFIKSSSIQSILLGNNRIQQIPSDVFDNVRKLRCLDLSWNRLSISELLKFGHENLDTLIFDHQDVMESDDMLLNDLRFDTTRPNFPNVRYLSLDDSFLDHSALYELFPNLHTIYWNSRYGEVRPEVLDYFDSHLTAVHLENNNLTRFEINDLKRLEQLYLDGNPLEYLHVEENRQLKIVSVADCNLRTRWNLSIPSLIALDLSGNRMDETLLGESFYNLISLQVLDLSRNRFTIVPRLERLSSITTLSLNYNSIESVDAVVTGGKLQTLCLRGNKISHIHPEAFANAREMFFLDLAENRLTFLDPELVKYFKFMQHLDLRSNGFKTVADMNVQSLIRLGNLLIGGNQFTSIDRTELQYFPERCTVHVI